MKTLQLIEITPEELRDMIMVEVRKELEIILRGHRSTEYMTEKEVLDYFKISRSALWNWTKKGILKKYGAGKKNMYKKEDVEGLNGR